ncbi:hypothetical protein R3W88_021614 [Solanum pinnatisectum]|uniref:Inhibitor I9 domain-containing protein n=1 Tax=Solanum pinnatisectum TaxID=50273 RepID=A0AAV9LSC6_9SOLN|nr:hypothetical protein R3W88_021614 [Solanum pinnatisectum]
MPQYRLILTIIGLICVLFPFTTNATEQNNSQIYIVHCEFPDGERTTRNQDLESYYLSFLPATTSDSSREAPRLIYSYRNVITGFAAKLSLEDLKEMEKMEGFVVNFMGLTQNMGFWNDSNYGKGVIIGVIDMGIFPDHPSFSDDGMPPPPAKWKGICQFNSTKWTWYTYCCTTAGRFVPGANIFGNANGTAVGVAPLAHVAVYKACDAISCYGSDVLAAIDMAIEDGVDVLSISLGN